MAEGGSEFGYGDPDLDKRLDHGSDEGKEQADTTHPFQAGAASTLYQPLPRGRTNGNEYFSSRAVRLT